jgi:hypothetical protein
MNNNRWILLGIALAFLLGMYIGSRNINTTPNAYAAEITAAATQPPPVALSVSGDNVFVLRGNSLTMYAITPNMINKSVRDFTLKAQISLGK